MNAQAAHCTLTHATLTLLQFLQVQKKEENLNREAEGGVEELQYLKHVVFAALHVCLCAIFLPLCILLHGSVVGAMRRRQGAGAAPHTEMYYLVLTASSI